MKQLISKTAILLCSLASITCNGQTRLLLTAALTNSVDSKVREQQYIKSFKRLANYGYDADSIYVVESLKKEGPTVLDAYSNHVLYSQLNDLELPLGYNEITAILDALDYFDFAPDDIIIKLTGRHSFIQDTFIEQAKNMGCDALFRPCSKKDATFFSVAFAMRCSCLREMCHWIRDNYMPPMNLEHHICIYCMRTPTLNVQFVKTLYVECYPAGSLSCASNYRKPPYRL